MSPTFRLAAGLLGLATALPGAAAVRQVVVAAAPVERAALVVSLTLPREFADGAILRDARGQPVPLQAEADLTAKFIIARQAANETLSFTLEPGRTPDQGNVQVVEEPSPPRPGNTPGIATATGAAMIRTKTGRLRVSVGGRPILYYQMDKDAVPREDIDPKWRRAGYLHPVLTPTGFPVTEGFSPDAPPHGPVHPGLTTRGPLTGRDDRRSYDFVDQGSEVASLEFGGIDNTWGGPVHGGFASWQRWVAEKGPDAVLVNESWQLTAYAVPKSLGEINVFDLAISRTNPTAAAVNWISQGLGVAGAAGWRQPNPAASSANPIFADEAGPGKVARWIGLTGTGQDRPAGIAILFPEPGPAKYSASPFEPSLMAPGYADSPPLAPNARTSLSQRIVVFDGAPDKALLAALWNGYTVPAVVTLSAP